ncbi:CsgG/HfaB family protein [Rubrivirga sp. IMCC43871]|uniref:CsgG/HfaB family protein n=1 Tax=Rubrivirga sp. IMCC43871 TaxID=3391575 RepID=UPI00398FB3A7
MGFNRTAALALAVLVMAGCSPRFLAPYATEAPRGASPRTATADLLESVPAPVDPVVVAVYRFRDQTGQYRALENLSTFSTSVTQGGTSILMRALEASGFFVPIEREGLSNLLNERQIITATRQQYTGPEGEGLGPLPPLLYAGVLLEGGIIGYDSNVITGGAGARILGVGANGQFRQDQVTIYLRAVSVQTGRVLKSVHTTKTIVSQKLDTGAFLFVDTDVLLETEAGYSTNEPPVLAVTAAIEEAVVSLVVDGARDGLWQFRGPDDSDTRDFLEAFDERRERDSRRDVFDRLPVDRSREGMALSLSGGLGQIESDYVSPGLQPVGAVGLDYPVRGGVSVGARGEGGFLDVNGEGEAFGGVAAILRARLVPTARTTPTVSVGLGALIAPDVTDDVFVYGTATAGIETRLSAGVGLFVEAGVDYPFSEGLDGLVGSGGVNDNVWVGRSGLVFYLPF